MSDKINYDHLSKARVMLFAAHGWMVELLGYDNNWSRIDDPRFNFSHRRYRIDLPPIPNGWRLVEMGEALRSVPVKRLYVDGTDWGDSEHPGSIAMVYEHVNVYAITPIAKPEPEPEEWITLEDWGDAKWEGCARLTANTLLTRKYVTPPIVYTYNGEKPEEFGLDENSEVLYWHEPYFCYGAPPRWADRPFGDLDPGDRWMKQPPAPEEVDDE